MAILVDGVAISMSYSKKRRLRKTSKKKAAQNADGFRRVTKQSVRQAGLAALVMWIIAVVLGLCLSANLIFAHYRLSHFHPLVHVYLAGLFAVPLAALFTWSWLNERKHLQNQTDKDDKKYGHV